MVRAFFILMAVILFGSLIAEAEKRAFVVGVGDYEELTDLQKTIGDANGYTEVLETDLGFQVTRLIDPSLEDFLNAFDTFLESIAPGDEIAFIFSGHGWSDGGDNFLALTDAPLQSSERMLKRATVSLSEDVLDELKSRKPGILFTIIDACRDNPFDLGTRTMTRGLVRQEMVQGTLVVYAAGARQKALDRLGPDDPSPYSVFTRSLLPKLRDPGRPLMRSVDEARNEVAMMATTIGHRQRPAVYSDISLDFCFGGTCATETELDPETQDWVYLESASYTAVDPCTKYARHLETYPNGKFAAVARRNLANPPCAPATRTLPAEITDAQNDPQNWRAVDPENLLMLNTSKGRVLIEMFPILAPKHVEQVKRITRAGHYDETVFHRVVRSFVAQGGDVKTTHGVDYPKIEAEFHQRISKIQMAGEFIQSERPFMEGIPEGYHFGMPVRWTVRELETPSDSFFEKAYEVDFWPLNCPGTAFAARTTADPDSGETQFYFNVRWAKRQDIETLENLEGAQTGWGRILDGMDVIETLEIGHPPENPDKILRAQLAVDMPETERPIALVQRPNGPDFQNFLQHAEGDEVCERRPVPARVAY
jgi:cyclophilin family peptidyl-prolyl cis-trans isomerase